MAQGGGLRTILATLLVATSLIAAGCDSSKPPDSPQIPARSTAPTEPSATAAATAVSASTPPPATVAATAAGTAATAVPTTPPSAAPSETVAPSASAIAAALATIEAADLTNDASLDAVGPLRFTSAGRDAAKAILERGSGNAGQIWAAIVVYAGTGTDPAPLRPYAASADSSIAVLSAATLVAFGDPTGFAVLARLLTSEQQLAGSHPPRLIGDFALTTLERYVAGGNVPAGDAESTVDGYLGEWSAWLAAHTSSLAFDPSTGTWGAP
jgi:hypothetical protein